MFKDESVIFVAAGNGGNGCVSFRREKFIPRGGPDGGDGGNGGSVILEAVAGLATLRDMVQHIHHRADNGMQGTGANKTGASGHDLILQVPPGTIVRDRDTKMILRDLDQPGSRVRVAAGGRGGKGNARFASATRRVPRFAQDGTQGEERWLHLELKLIADVGVIGLPNAGKSTFLGRVSPATRPKVADYPFTTIHPGLGVLELDSYRRLILADMPGLIEGAHDGKGLGDRFLRHIERTRVLLHMVDVSPQAMQPADEAYRTIRHELDSYGTRVSDKIEIVAGTKIDMPGWEENLAKLSEAAGQQAVPVSSFQPKTLGALVGRLADVFFAEEDEESGSSGKIAVEPSSE